MHQYKSTGVQLHTFIVNCQILTSLLVTCPHRYLQGEVPTGVRLYQLRLCRGASRSAERQQMLLNFHFKLTRVQVLTEDKVCFLG